MTIQTEFWNWQSSPLQPDPGRCAPIMVTLNRYLRDRWGGQDLGCYARRPVVGGTSLSSHGSGAATDWRYQDPGMGRSRMLNECMPWLIDNSLELGVQAIHDYVGCRIWRPPGTSGRPSQPSPESGWRQQTPGSQMGQSWALWLHVECLNTRWSDTRSIDEMLGSSSIVPPSPTPPEEPEVITDDDVNRISSAVATRLASDLPFQWAVAGTIWATSIGDGVTNQPQGAARMLSWARNDAFRAANNWPPTAPTVAAINEQLSGGLDDAPPDDGP